LLSFAKLPLLLTPLTYIHVGDIEINYFVPKMVVHDLIRGSPGYIFILNIPEFETNSYTDTRIA